MAHHHSGHSLGSLCCLPVLFHLFPESVYRCALPSRVWHSRGTSAPDPPAHLAVPAGRVFNSYRRERHKVILGYVYPHGVWFYFTILFVLKYPPGLLGLLLLVLSL